MIQFLSHDADLWTCRWDTRKTGRNHGCHGHHVYIWCNYVYILYIYIYYSKVQRNSRHMSHAISGQAVPALPLVWELCRIWWKLMHEDVRKICSKYVGGIIRSLLSWHECHHTGGSLVKKTWHIAFIRHIWLSKMIDHHWEDFKRDTNIAVAVAVDTRSATCRMGCLSNFVGNPQMTWKL